MRDRSPYLLTFIACLALLFGAGGLGAIGGIFAPGEAEQSFEEAETVESEDPTFARTQREVVLRTRRAPRALLTPSGLPVARQNPLRGAPPRDAWRRPRRC